MGAPRPHTGQIAPDHHDVSSSLPPNNLTTVRRPTDKLWEIGVPRADAPARAGLMSIGACCRHGSLPSWPGFAGVQTSVPTGSPATSPVSVVTAGTWGDGRRFPATAIVAPFG